MERTLIDKSVLTYGKTVFIHNDTTKRAVVHEVLENSVRVFILPYRTPIVVLLDELGLTKKQAKINYVRQ